MTKFSIGDKVRILDGSNIKNYTGSWFMPTNIGKEGTIARIEYYSHGRIGYYMNELWGCYDERGLELVRDSSNTYMPEIVNYTYDESTGMTKIKWSDKTETTVYSEIATEPDQHKGFLAAYAKKAAGNTSHINNLYDKWAIKKPIKDKLAEEKRIARETEEKRIAEKRRAKREKWLIRKEALRIKREYEARKLANEKYGVPLDED